MDHEQGSTIRGGEQPHSSALFDYNRASAVGLLAAAEHLKAIFDFNRASAVGGGLAAAEHLKAH